MEKLQINNNENNSNNYENLENPNQNENLMEIENNITDKKPIFITSTDKLSKRKRRRNSKNIASNEIKIEEKIKFPKFKIVQNKEEKIKKPKHPKEKIKEKTLEIKSKKQFSNNFFLKIKITQFPYFFSYFEISPIIYILIKFKN